jgi:hypothetical protein
MKDLNNFLTPEKAYRTIRVGGFIWMLSSVLLLIFQNAIMGATLVVSTAIFFWVGEMCDNCLYFFKAELEWCEKLEGEKE